MQVRAPFSQQFGVLNFPCYSNCSRVFNCTFPNIDILFSDRHVLYCSCGGCTARIFRSCIAEQRWPKNHVDTSEHLYEEDASAQRYEDATQYHHHLKFLSAGMSWQQHSNSISCKGTMLDLGHPHRKTLFEFSQPVPSPLSDSAFLTTLS